MSYSSLSPQVAPPTIIAVTPFFHGMGRPLVNSVGNGSTCSHVLRFNMSPHSSTRAESTAEVNTGGEKLNTAGSSHKTNTNNSQGNSNDGDTKEEHRGKSYEHYPERQEGHKYDRGFFQGVLLGESRDAVDKVRCERNVVKCIDRSPIVKLMLSALKSSGCEIDIRRHISCENCSKKVTGGYDPELNQVVVCQNTARSEGMVQGVLAHEFVHMFDKCRAKLDLNSIDHLACTEIRAANLMHCSFMSSMTQGTASPFSIAKQHAECVKFKAIASILAVRNVTPEQASEAVERVFTKCYNDLEPVGRRIRRNSLDMEKAYRERYHYGYID